MRTNVREHAKTLREFESGERALLKKQTLLYCEEELVEECASLREEAMRSHSSHDHEAN